MRILYVLPSLLTGGAEAVVSQWALWFQQQPGYEVAVCTLYTDGPFARRLQAGRIPIHNLNFDPGIQHYRLHRKYDPRLALSLARLVRRGGYQVVHAHLFPAFLYTSLVAWAHPHPAYFYSEHSVRNRRRRYPFLKPLERLLYSRYQKILAVSEEVRKALVGWLPELGQKTRVVPNTVDPARFRFPEEQIAGLREQLGLTAEVRVVLFAGRLVPEKGADLLIEALSHCDFAQNLPLRVLVCGDGPLKPTLQARLRASSVGLPPGLQVDFLGNRDDIPQLLNLVDLVVIPSRWEGLPVVLLEAMAAGRAVLAARVGGIPEAITHGMSGWLVEPGDVPSLAHAVDMLLAHPDLRRHLGEQASQVFEQRYSPDVALQELFMAYHSSPTAVGG